MNFEIKDRVAIITGSAFNPGLTAALVAAIKEDKIDVIYCSMNNASMTVKELELALPYAGRRSTESCAEQLQRMAEQMQEATHVITNDSKMSDVYLPVKGKQQELHEKPWLRRGKRKW